jgi:coatomer subunit alpha
LILYKINKVSSCCFHPKIDAIISNSEDKTTRVWGLDKRNEIERYKSESERFWVICVKNEYF